MKKVITAINNPKLNEELKKQKNFEIIGKDILYKEAILEILEKNNQIDLINLSEKTHGEIKFEKLIEKIRRINENIKIIFILEKENNNLEKILIKNNILDIYYNNKINLNELIKIINKEEINMEEEIIKLKEIIKSKNIKIKNSSKRNFLKNLKKEIKRKIKKIKEISIKEKNRKEKERKIVTFSGNYKSGKSTIAFIICQYLSKENNSVLLIDGDMEKSDLSFLLKKDKKKRNIKIKKNKFNLNKKRKILKINNEDKKLINKNKTIYYYKIKNNIKKINKNLFLLKNLNVIIKNQLKRKKQMQKKVVLIFLKLIQKNYDFIIIELSKNNDDEINREILKNSSKNFVLMEANLLGVREIRKILKKYFYNWNLSKNNLYVICNKKNIHSVNINLLYKILFLKNKILKINENKYYKEFLNNRKIYIHKIIKKEANKIIKIINL